MSPEEIQVIALALGLGLLVGMQRERQAHPVAGIRTFALITLLGALSGLLAQRYGNWSLAIGALGVAAVLAIGNWKELHLSRQSGSGVTTEIAALVLFFVGAALAAGATLIAVTVAGLAAVLLQWKAPLHGIVERIGKGEFHAIMQLVLVALIVLPMLPNRTYGPYDVLNPFRIWLMVALIVALSLASFLVAKLVGARRGALLSGVLGGMISSTATTVGYARRSRGRAAAGITALVILLASTILNARVLIEIGIVAPSLLSRFVLPFALVGGWMLLLCGLLYLRAPAPPAAADDEHANPGQLKTALVFGAMYAVILFAVAAAKEHFGDRGMYLVSVISGLTDVDALTLTAAELVSKQRLDGDTAWRMVMTGAMSNLVFKFGIVAALGSGRVIWYVAAFFALSLAAGLALLFLLPPVALW